MSHEAEQAVLGAIMLDASAWHRAAAIIGRDDFASPDHRELWALLAELIERSAPVDAVTVGEIAEQRNASVGGIGYVIGLADSTPGTASVEAYAEIVRDHAIRRRLRHVGQKLAKMELTGDLALDEAQRMLGAVSGIARAQSVSLKEALRAVRSRMEERFGGVSLPVVPTPWGALNNLLGGGLGRGKLYIGAGRPGMGKTAFVRGVAVSAAELGHAALISLEMDREEVAGMMLAGAAGVSYQHIRDPRSLPDDDWSPITAGFVALADRPISICDVPGLSLPAITAEARRLHAKRPLSALMIDYLGLVDLPGADRQDIAIGQVTRGLKRLARDLNCPVVLLAQLSRRVEERSDKRPMLSDLRDAGQIEQDADGIIMLYREKYYRPDTELGDIAEMHLAKQRGGRTGTVPVEFRGETIEFIDYHGQWPIPQAERGGKRGSGIR